jgi:molybdopterin-guanine dinucleotide biosynthesis protein A
MENITAIILAGGKSSRIGSDKAFLKLNGESVIERICNLLKKIFSNVIIISNNPDKFHFLTPNVYKDIYPNFGPLSGVHSGLTNSQTENNFFISCDMPLITVEVIRFILTKMNNSDITIVKTESNIQTLLGIYKKSCLARAEELLSFANSQKDIKSGKTNVKLFDLINQVKTTVLDISSEKFYNDDMFINMNTSEDYQKVKDILGAKN